MTTVANVLPIPEPDDTPVEIETDGSCIRETSNNLEHAPDPDERLTPQEIEEARQLAADIVAKVVATYSARVAAGEVGRAGSGTASTDAASSGRCPTGLLYGKVQSGKTRAMIFTAAMCLDNGFRTVIVLTSDNLKLVEQTTDRFRAIDGPIVLHSQDTGQWDADQEHIRRNLGHAGLIIVCAKNSRHQRNLNELLRQVGAPDHPAIIFDDEADQATLDTTRAARAAGHASAPAHASTTHRLTVENTHPLELGDSLRETLRHNVFAQVTATPFALLLQGVDDALRPGFTHIVEPGTGYTGGSWFFSEDAVANGTPPICFVPAAESANIAQASPDDPSNLPDGLALALSTFCLSAAARHVRTNAHAQPNVFLCHTSAKTDDHQHLEQLIRSYLGFLLEGLTATPRSPAVATAFANARTELAKTCQLNDDEFERSLQWIARRLQNRNVSTVNYRNGDFAYQPGLNFLIGGNILGRGLTIKNLLVTYYLRAPRTTQMDTMLQHARMFGYAQSRSEYLRIFLPPVLARRFRHIVETETELRDYLARGAPGQPVPVRVVNALRATRPNVLDTASLSAYRPGQQVYPMEPEFEPDRVRPVHDRITRILQQQVFRGDIREREFVDAPMAVAKEIIESVRLRDNNVGTWDVGGIKAVLDDLEPDSDGIVRIYVRTGVNTSFNAIYSGAASGDEITDARAEGKPVLMLFEQQGQQELGWGGAPFWFPTVVFPTDMDARIFNVD